MILIATPTRDQVTAGFAGDLVKLCRRHPDARFCALLGIYIAQLRCTAVRIAHQTRATHVLFIDADMRFPEDALDRLLAHDKPIVAANYVQRTMPEWWVSRTDGISVSSLGRVGREAVDSTGCGLMLIRTDVFARLQGPCFQTPVDPLTDQQIGEDLFFCQQARAADFSIWIDHDLSQQVRHQALIEYGVQAGEALAMA